MCNKTLFLFFLLCGTQAANLHAMQPWERRQQTERRDVNFDELPKWQKAIFTTVGGATVVGALFGLWKLCKTTQAQYVGGRIGEGFNWVARPVAYQFQQLSEDFPRATAFAIDFVQAATLKAIAPPFARMLRGLPGDDFVVPVVNSLATERLQHGMRVLNGEVVIPQSVAGHPIDERQTLVGAVPEEVQTALALARSRRYFDRLHATKPQAILFVGPSGTGKTMTAKYIAHAAGVDVLIPEMTEIVDKYIGETRKNLKRWFKTARQLAERKGNPFTVLFFDEFDAAGFERNNVGESAAGQELIGLVTQLLTEMDGFEGNSRVLVIAATNHPERLDSAIKKRFATTVHFSLPNAQMRHAVLRSNMTGRIYRARDEERAQLNGAAELDAVCTRLAADAQTAGFSHRELAQLVERAAQRSAKRKLGEMARLGHLMRLSARLRDSHDAGEQVNLRAQIAAFPAHMLRHLNAIYELVRFHEAMAATGMLWWRDNAAREQINQQINDRRFTDEQRRIAAGVSRRWLRKLERILAADAEAHLEDPSDEACEMLEQLLPAWQRLPVITDDVLAAVLVDMQREHQAEQQARLQANHAVAARMRALMGGVARNRRAPVAAPVAPAALVRGRHAGRHRV